MLWYLSLVITTLLSKSVQQEMPSLFLSYPKFVYQKDMAEYCRRNVIPSVFLGKQVVGANSQIYHFSRLHTPYSCDINVRTEMGNTIIVVIQIKSDQDMNEICEMHGNQLLIYEIGETFGGYWADIPDIVLEPGKHRDDRSYTLSSKQTTPDSTKLKMTKPNKPKPLVIKNARKEYRDREEHEGKYLTVEVPIMNVSAVIVPGRLNDESAFPTEDQFDTLFNVTPGSEVEYDTKIVPLLEVKVEKKKGGLRGGDVNVDIGDPEVQVEFNELFTIDPRITFSPYDIRKPKSKSYKYHPSVNKRLDFKKNKQLFLPKDFLYNKRVSPQLQLSTVQVQQYNYLSKLYDFMQSPRRKGNEEENEQDPYSWDAIHNILKNLSKSSDNPTESPHKELANFLQGIFNNNVHTSVYLNPAVLQGNDSEATVIKSTTENPSPLYKSTRLELIDILNSTSKSQDSNKLFNKSNAMINNDSAFNIGENNIALLPLAFNVDSIILNVTNGNENSLNKNISNDKLLETSNEKFVAPKNIFEATSVHTEMLPSISEVMRFTPTTQKRYFDKTSYEVATTVKTKELINSTAEVINPSNITTPTKVKPEGSTVAPFLDSKQLFTGKSILSDDKKLNSATVSLVDRESWENIVNVAPAIAVKLNQTGVNDEKREVNVEASMTNKDRKKRWLHALDIDVAAPHHIAVLRHHTTTRPPKKFNMWEFQQAIELQDDEIHSRIPMKYQKQYVGRPVLDLCASKDTTNSYVYLFNTSRLLLAISNFTLKGMTVIMTPARTLLYSESRCSDGQLECQVSGARVCIDSLCACDGIPNCGSYEIYDEDRLTCGVAAGLKNNVYLAAVTFLAVLLTVLYTVHYWLKRCVPKVSDAFFIYTDAAENILYLNPIMRSPHDVGFGVTKEFDRGAMQQYMECEDIEVKPNAFKRFKTKLLSFFRCRHKKKVSEGDEVVADLENLPQRRLSTFVEMELSKMPGYGLYDSNCVDEAVQTGSSIEMVRLNVSPADSEQFGQDHSMDMHIQQPIDELNMLKFFRKARVRSVSLQVDSTDDTLIDMSQSGFDSNMEEKEIKFQEYDPALFSIDETIQAEKASQITDVVEIYEKKPAESIQKHLRFQEEDVVIPAEGGDENVEEPVDPIATTSRRSVMLGANKVFRIQDSNDANELERPSNTGKELKSYFNWGSGKEKKKKKKPNKKK